MSLAAVAGVLVLVGCSGGDDSPPRSSSTTSTSATSSSTTSTTPSSTTTTASGPSDAYPPAARAKTVEGGKAFVEYYFATLNKLYQAPKTGVLPTLAARSCVFCQRNEKSVQDLLDGGGRYMSAPVQLKGLAPMGGAPKGQQYYQATSVQVGAWVVDKAGKKVHRDNRSSLPVSIAVVWSGGSWKLYGADKA